MQPIGKKSGVVIQNYQEETLIYDTETNKAFCLNVTSAQVWKACDGNRTVSDVTEHLKRELDDSVNEEVVRFALDQLLKEGLIENYESNSDAGAGISRRSALKTLGLSTAVALPIIASLIAPPASFSQSTCGLPTGRAPGCSCTVNTQCTSNNCSGSPMTCM